MVNREQTLEFYTEDEPMSVKRGTWLRKYTKNPDGVITLELACGHIVNAEPKTDADREMIGRMLEAHDSGTKMFTDCGQCQALPELTPEGAIH